MLKYACSLNILELSKDPVNNAMKIVFQAPTFSLQLLRVIGETYYKGADIGGCLSTAYRIKKVTLRVGIKNGYIQHKGFTNTQRTVLLQDIK